MVMRPALKLGAIETDANFEEHRRNPVPVSYEALIGAHEPLDKPYIDFKESQL